VMTKGLLGAFRAYTDLGRRLIAERTLDIGSPSCTAEDIDAHNSEPRIMGELGSKFLAEAFQRSTRIRYDDSITFLDTFMSTYTTVVIISVLSTLLFWVGVYVPQMRRLDRDIKDVRLLLLLFPDEVARSVPAIIKAGQEMMKEAGGARTGGGH